MVGQCRVRKAAIPSILLYIVLYASSTSSYSTMNAAAAMEVPSVEVDVEAVASGGGNEAAVRSSDRAGWAGSSRVDV